MKDTQDTQPQIQKKLERVGITDLKAMVETKWGGRNYLFFPTIEITIDLQKDKKGVHMSRLIEAIIEAIEEETHKRASSLEETEKHILERLSKTHPYSRGEIRLETDFLLEKTTPSTGKRTREAHKVWVTVINDGGHFIKRLKVSVIGNTVCPHAMETAGKPHIQRAIGELELETNHNNYIDLQQMIECVERSFSAEVYTLLKTKDEKMVVEKMYSNPKFVEDVVRSILDEAASRFAGCIIHARAVSHESIHRHNVIAEGSSTSESDRIQ